MSCVYLRDDPISVVFMFILEYLFAHMRVQAEISSTLVLD